MQVKRGATHASARELQRTFSRSHGVPRYKLAWNVGDKLSLFFPIAWVQDFTNLVPKKDEFGNTVFDDQGQVVMEPSEYYDMVVASMYGHKVNNMKEFPVGTAFIPSLTDVVDGKPVRFIKDANGDIQYDVQGNPMYELIPGDATYQFSKIAPFFIKGVKDQELAKLMSKQFSNEALRREAILQVEDKYDTSKHMDAPKPVIGRLSPYGSTEVVAVKVVDGKYNVEKAGLYCFEFSQEKLSSLISILSDPKYSPSGKDARWFEVQITYNGTSNDTAGRAEAGRKANFIGLTDNYRMEKVDPEAYAALQARLNQLPMNDGDIKAHNRVYTPIAEHTIVSRIQSYMINKGEYLGELESDDDVQRLIGQAVTVMKYDGILNIMNQEVKNKILERYLDTCDKDPALLECLKMKEENFEKLTDDASLMERLKAARSKWFHQNATIKEPAKANEEADTLNTPKTARELFEASQDLVDEIDEDTSAPAPNDEYDSGSMFL